MRRVTRKSKLASRWLQLFFSSAVLFSTYYCYDNPAALHDQLRDYFVRGSEGISPDAYEVQFNMLYTVYSIPNMVIPIFIGGTLCVRYGAARCAVGFSLIVLFGQIIFACGMSSGSLGIMLLGRFVFGLGGENLSVAVSTILQEWFFGAELGLSMGISLSVSRLGSVLNNIISPALAASSKSASPPTIFGVFVAIGGAVSAIAAERLDRLGAQALLSKDRRDAEERKASYDEGGGADPLAHPRGRSRASRWSKVMMLPSAFWLLSLSCVAIYGIVLPFNNIASNLLIEKFLCQGPCCPSARGVKAMIHPEQQCARAVRAEAAAGYIMGIPFTVSAVLTPFVGALTDRYGYAALLTAAAACLLIIVHLQILLGDSMPVYPLILQGVAYSAYAACLWPSVGTAVRREDSAVAYGLMTSLQNCGLAAIPLIVGSLKVRSGGYDGVETFFIILGFVGLFSSSLVNYFDFKHHRGALNKPFNHRRRTGKGSELDRKVRSIIEAEGLLG